MRGITPSFASGDEENDMVMLILALATTYIAAELQVQRFVRSEHEGR